MRLATATDRIVVTEHVATLATERSVMLTPAEPDLLPEHLRRPDGTSRLRARNSEVFATQELLDAEARLLDGAAAEGAPAVPAATASVIVERPLPGSAHHLSAEQAAAALQAGAVCQPASAPAE